MDLFAKDAEAFGPTTSDMLDLRFGNAGFLAPYWDRLSNDFLITSSNRYGYAFAAGNDNLKEAITKLHAKIGNAVTADRHIVIAVGASQALQAALYALKRSGVSGVYAEAPYFARFPHFAEYAGLQWNKAENSVQIVTNPNNPDSQLSNPQSKVAIHDYCYNWPQYIEKVVNGDQDIMIFSLAKATGHASSRIGWAIVKDPKIAKDMEHFIEIQTCGVSAEAQLMARQVLINQANMEYGYTVFKHGADKLRNRWEMLKKEYKDINKFDILNNSGMFVWGKMKESQDSTEYFKSLNILTTNGDYFGMPDRSYFRINIGCEVDKFLKLVEILKSEKQKSVIAKN